MRIDVSVRIAYTVGGKRTRQLSGETKGYVQGETAKGESVYEDFILRNKELR